MRLGDLDHLLLKLDAELSDDARYIEIADQIRDIIDNAPTVEEVSVIEFKEPLPLVKAQKIVKALSKRPQGKWYENIPKGCLKARHGDYVLYKVDFLLDNLAREVNIMEGARIMRGYEKNVDYVTKVYPPSDPADILKAIKESEAQHGR